MKRNLLHSRYLAKSAPVSRISLNEAFLLYVQGGSEKTTISFSIVNKKVLLIFDYASIAQKEETYLVGSSLSYTSYVVQGFFE